MGCDYNLEYLGDTYTCQFPETTEVFPCDGKSYCCFHLPMEEKSRKPTEKENWKEVDELTKFNKITFKFIREEAEKEEIIDLRGVIFPGDIDFVNLSKELEGLPAISFVGAEFNGNTYFTNCKFSGGTDFTNCKFYGDEVNFKFSTFSGNTTAFDYAVFECQEVVFTRSNFLGGGAGFTGAKFIGGAARFPGAVFNCPVSMDNTTFKEVPDFRRTYIKAHFTLKGVEVNFSKEPVKGSRFRWKAIEERDPDRLRRLKQMAADVLDHDREQKFFALELQAKRDYETTDWALISSYLYEWLSDFGRSIKRPLLGLLVIWISNGLFFADCPNFGACTTFGEGMKKSTSFLFPFLGASQNTLKYGLQGFDVFLGFLEGGLGLVFLFLIGLALRNRFRI
jgi:hypothetical protein